MSEESTTKALEVGERVIVTAPGTFHGYAGTVVRVSRRGGPHGGAWIRIVFDDHPWQEPGVDWAFSPWELEAAS